MQDPVQQSALAIVVISIWMLGVTRLTSSVYCYGVQTLLLGGLALAVGVRQHESALTIASVVFLGLKGVLIPVYLLQVIRRLDCRRDEGLLLAPPLLMMLALGLLGGLLVDQPLTRVIPESAVPSMGLLLTSMLLMLTRRMAISQIVGFLVLENGIFLYTITQPHSMPLIVELGVLLDILVWTMMAVLLAFRIKDRFGDLDLARLRDLHE